MPEVPNHDRLNQAVVSHLAVAMEAQNALADVVDLNASYEADITSARLVVGGRPLQVLLMGTVSKQSNTWLWSWANQGFSPELPAIAPVRRVIECGGAWNLWELGTPVFDLAGLVDTGLGAGASVALVAAAALGAVGFYAADYGAGTAYFAIVDPGVPRPVADLASFPRRILAAIDVYPGHGRSQLLTYALAHGLPVRTIDNGLAVEFPGGQVMNVEFDNQARPSRFSSAQPVR